MNLHVKSLSALVLIACYFGLVHSEMLQCNTADGWFSLGFDKCYKLFHGPDERTWQRATEVCQNYGSRLVSINDQYENNLLGNEVKNRTTRKTSIWIGLKKSNNKFAWMSGSEMTVNQGLWGDNQPNEGDCVYQWPNEQTYVYDRPYVWGLDTCYAKLAYVCEKMAYPSQSFPCFSGGFVKSTDQCNGNNDCPDGSDELNCPNLCHYKLEGRSGVLPSIRFQNEKTCTWAIEAPLGTNVYIKFESFNTEFQADFVTVYSGSIIETSATQVARLSGTEGSMKQYRSYNNMMLIKFSSDSEQISQGFTASYDSVDPTSGHVIQLEAIDSPQLYTLDTFIINGVTNVLGMTDYIFVISAPASCSQIVTLEIMSLKIHDTDKMMFFDGDTPRYPVLETVCNSCSYQHVVYSTGASLSILLQTQRGMSENVQFSFRYRQGCYYETSNSWGQAFTPGYPGNIQYPNNVDCTWKINAPEPITLYFENDLEIQYEGDGWQDDKELLQIFDNNTAVHSGDGFNTPQLTSTNRMVQISTGLAMLRFKTSPTRSARGFLVNWSKGCPDPMFDANTIVQARPTQFYYTYTTSLSCATGYAFQQTDIAPGTPTIDITCQYMGKWNHLHVPKCTPRYCGEPRLVTNGYVQAFTGPEYGDTVTYQCFTGSTLESVPIYGNNSTCTSNGQWTTPPTCRSASCPFDNARTTVTDGGATVDGTGSDIGSIITYTCNEGYQFVGEPISICKDDGSWSSNKPSCIKKTCWLSTAIKNGFYNGKNPLDLINYNDVVAVTCNSGYELVDAQVNSVTCQANRTLTQLPSCKNVDECVANKPCDHNCYDTEGSFYCTCNQGYNLLSSGTSSPDTRCNNIDECQAGTHKCDGGCVDTIGGYTCSCSLPYVLYTADATSGYSLPAGESGLLSTDTYYINHTCVLKSCPEPLSSISNGKLLTKRVNHRVGDFISYQCNIGFKPTFTTLECLNSGDWDRQFPDCVPATCNTESVNGPVNRAVFSQGPYTYGQQLYLNCTKASQTFSQFRFCTYNVLSDQYEMQGSSYECGVIDCGQPGEGQTASQTVYGSSFTYQCNGRVEGTSHEGDRLVRCRENGFWDFGNMQCFGNSCTDPGHPAGGDIVATSFADGSEVTFTCSKQGYELTSSTPLKCNSNTWSGNVPQCVDAEKPKIINCPTDAISLERYSRVADTLSTLNINVNDNTGIKAYTMTPSNANTTLYLVTDTLVTIRAEDYRGNFETCTINFLVKDETPPSITCPNTFTVRLAAFGQTVDNTFNQNTITRTDNKAIQSFNIFPDLQTSFVDADLFKTFTYTATTTDQENNAASCKFQLFVDALSCSDNSFPTPLHATRQCNNVNNDYVCTFTCENEYTFEDTKQKVVTCSGGSWNSDFLPACTRDITAPRLSCPGTRLIYLTESTDVTSRRFQDDTAITDVDINTISSREYNPTSYNFTASDLYKTRSVQYTVRDVAGNSASCNLQYLTLPDACSPLSLRRPSFAKDNVCTPTGNGYSCKIECIDGYILRNIGKTTTVTCTTSRKWADNAIFPACISDSVAPSLTCPTSSVVELSEMNEVKDITTTDYNDYVVDDVGGVAGVVYTPTQLQVTPSSSSVQTVTVTASDLSGNRRSCQFYLTVTAKACSPLSLPTPENGQKTCTQTQLGWSCEFTCNQNYKFPSDPTATSKTSTCTGSSDFSVYVPACAFALDLRSKEFFGTLSYQYLPNDATTSVANSCVDHYLNRQALQDTASSQSVFQSMAARLQQICFANNDISVSITFLKDLSSGTITNGRDVTLNYRYTMTSTPVNLDKLLICRDTIKRLTNSSSYSFTFPINGDGASCPSLDWNSSGVHTDTSIICPSPYFEAYPTQDFQQCMRCPAGTSYNAGGSCTICPKNTYRSFNSLSGSCQSCPNGFITNNQGSTSSSDCIAPCDNGEISATGFGPCHKCPIGTFWRTSSQCSACPSGQTTPTTGADSDTLCSVPTATFEKCSLGTQSTGGDNCELCPIGTLRDLTSQTTCRSCVGSTSTYIRGAVDPAECYSECPSGMISNTGMPPCQACAAGTISVNTTYCQPCPSGSTPVGNQCVSESVIRVKCPAGTFRDGAGNCKLCPVGTYNGLEEQSQCVACSPFTSTYTEGAITSSSCFSTCAPGFRSNTGLSPCVPCGRGSYSVNATTCKSCDNGATTATTTATSAAECIAQCPAGQFSFSGYNENGRCRNCPVTYYQSNVRSTSCSRCNQNQYTLSSGRTLQSDCQSAAVKCNPNPCQNSGTCGIVDHDYRCTCPTGFYGNNCQFRVNYCDSSPCYNGGICSYTAAGFTCDCQGRSTGDRCETINKICSPDGSLTCQNGGFCVNYGIEPRYKCLCLEKYTGNRCEQQKDICAVDINPCQSPGSKQCIDDSKGQDIRRLCECFDGYTGEFCEKDIDECASMPCINGGTCNNFLNSFTCTCPTGYSGRYCQVRADRCTTQTSCNAPHACIDDYTEDQPRCVCAPGYAYGTYSEYSIKVGQAPQATSNAVAEVDIDNFEACQARCTQQNCVAFTYGSTSNKCYIWTPQSDTTVTSFTNHNTYFKQLSTPDDDFYTQRFTERSGIWASNVCAGTLPLDVKCCQNGDPTCQNALPTGTVCEVNRCLTGGSGCTNVDVLFKCAASRVFLTNRCIQKADYCNVNPCQNGGNCGNLFGTFVCSCQVGFTGQRCQTNIDDCAQNPCRPGITCNDLDNDYQCDCITGWTGKNCNTPTNFCDGNTCSSNGFCVNGPLSYTCNCFPGYTGVNCENELNKCQSNPCLHDGTCIKLFNDYSCSCVNGWQGKNCETIATSCNGAACFGTCYDIFNDFYCKCGINTYGRNCATQTLPCTDYNKCVNSGVCSMNGTDMTCQCTDFYQGDGCQIKTDICGTTDPCKNGATCKVTGSMSYTCDCMPGYTGKDCGTEINECNGVFCAGTCIDDINKYHCRCPLKKTGTSCNRDYDRNYDLFFNNPMGQGYAWIPYPIQVENGNFMSISLWVRFATEGGQGVFLSMFVGDVLSESSRFIEFSETGITVYLKSSTHNLRFDQTADITNGHWHLFNMVCNMVTGEMELFLDTVRYGGTLQDQELLMPGVSFRFWTILGCKFDQVTQRCSGSQFHGYLSQVNWYQRELFYRRVSGIQNIPNLFENAQQIYDQPISDMLLVWNEYELQSGVSRMIPSEANSDFCNKPTRNPPCRSYTVFASPSASNCPNDIVEYSADRLKRISWTIPTFSNLGNGIVHQADLQPGNTFTWGVYGITYVAQAENGNRGYCSFKIYMSSTQCSDQLPSPYSGLQQCDSNSPAGWTGCTPSCTLNTQKIDRDHPNYFTCSAMGGWNIAMPFQKFRYPACGAISAPKSRVEIQLIYDLDSAACIRVQSKMKAELLAVFMELNTFYNMNLCSNADCKDITMTIHCEKPTASVDIVIPSADPAYMFGSVKTSVESFLNYYAYAHNKFDFSDDIPADLRRCVGIHIAASSTCPEGRALVDNQCVECGPGNYYRVLDNGQAICDDCPIGTYTASRGQTTCQACPNGQTTSMTGTFDQADCKGKCPVGEYYDNNQNRCEKCAIGFYQDTVGQFFCKPCGLGFTTEFTGTNSSSRCSATCDHGSQLDGQGNCVPCQIGTYRNASESRLCKSCQGGFITPLVGSTSQTNCTVVSCEAGNYRDADLNKCFACAKGTYQDQKWQLSCKLCNNTMPERYTTLNTASTKQTDCIFFCDSGYEVASEGQCTACSVYKYKNNDDDFRSLCKSCPNDFKSNVTASTSASQCTIFLCDAGYKPNAKNDGCDPCPVGTFNDVQHSTSCQACPIGTSTVTTNSTSSSHCINYCESGQYRTSTGACLQCPKGKYKNNDEGVFQQCQNCPQFYTTANAGSKTSTDCSIRNCPAGTKRNTDDTVCIACPIGQYQPAENQDFCFSCTGQTSTRQNGSTAISQCEFYCQSGQHKLNTVCVACERGYYKNNDDGVFGACQLCPSDFITTGTGAKLLSECNVGNCTAGYKLNALNQCEECPKGFFSDRKWLRSCTRCGLDKTTEKTGADSVNLCILECQPGYEDVGSSCQKCARGYYKPETAAAACTKCPNGTATESTGSTAMSDCSLPYCAAGQYLDRSGTVPLCKMCPYDMFQSQPLQESCINCPGGLVTLKTGATASNDCVRDCNSGLEYDPSTQNCKYCERGYYRNKDIRSQGSCQMCPIEFITANLGATDLTQCNITNCTQSGTYRNPTTNVCTDCAIGFYNAEKWKTSCNECPTGQSTRTTGASSLSDCRRSCPLGQYVNPDNQCVLCSRGSYRSDVSQDNCTKCPNGLLTPFSGADSADECRISPCGVGEKYSLDTQKCSKCESGTYQSQTGAFQCEDCPYDPKYTSRLGATTVEECRSPCRAGQQFDIPTETCSNCPVGTYQPEAKLFRCIDCPEDKRFTQQTGSTTSAQCLNHCDSASANTCSVNATCTATSSDPRGYRCRCFSNYDDIGSVAGNICKHKCDNNFCKNGATCLPEPTPTCQCTEWYKGNACNVRKNAEELSTDDTKDILIPVAIGVGGLLLFLILMAVACLCWKARSTPKSPTRYSEYQNERVEKGSMYSYDYGQQQPYMGGGRLMMQPAVEMVYDNAAYKDPSKAGSVIDSAIYNA